MTFTSLIHLLQTRVSEIPDHTAYTFLSYEDDREQAVTLTFKEVDLKARRIAADLKRRGLKNGDRVIILSTQTYDNVLSVWGAVYAGAVFSLIPPPIDQQKQERFESVLESARPRFVMGNSMVAEKLGEALQQKVFYELPNIVARHIPESWQPALARKLVKWKKGFEIYDVERCPENESKWKKPPVNEHTVVCLQYSSGSTAKPKGVILTHGNFLHNIKLSIDSVNFADGDTFLSWVPFFHNMGLTIHIFTPVYSRSNSVIQSPLDFREKPIRWFQALSKWKAALTSGPNAAYRLCSRVIQAEDLAGVDLSNLKIAANGSEQVEYRSLQAFAEKFASVGFSLNSFAPGYGLAEFTTLVTATNRNQLTTVIVDTDELSRNRFLEVGENHPKARHMVSVGAPLPAITVGIVNPDTGNPCPPGEIGEIWLQGDSAARGYWQKPDESRTTFRNTLEGHEGYFLRTGDLGIVHQENLYITGRIKELIIIHGKNYYSADFENGVKKTIPLLTSGAVVSFSVSVGNEEKLVSLVEIPPGNAFDFKRLASDICQTTSKSFGFSQYDVVFVESLSLPRTDNAKIKIIQCKKNYTDGKLPALFSMKQEGIAADTPRSIVVPQNRLERDLVDLFGKVLRASFEIGADDRFFDIGGDSLSASEVVTEVNGRYGIKVPMKLFFEEPTARHLTHIIETLQREGSTANVQRKALNLHDECVLPDDIQPSYPGMVPNDLSEIRNIFLTGGTGFLGAYIIRDMLAHTGATIHCLVRANDRAFALQRIRKNLSFYNLWREEFHHRIVPVVGDLGKPLLGIKEEEFNRLASLMDAVFHNGALLNFIYPYTTLRQTNVFGTQEALRLGCIGRPKRFFYISSFSVFDNPSHFGTVAYEDDPLECCDGYFLGYTESKWVAEKLVRIAGSRGLAVTIFRPGEISGDHSQGIWPMNDLVIRFLITCVQFNCMPDMNISLHMTPVDYVSQAIARLAFRDDSISKAYHLVNTKIMALPQIAEFLSSFGYDVKLIPYEEWKKKIFVFANDSALRLVESLFTEERKSGESLHERYGNNQASFDRSNTLAGLAGTGITCPPITDQLLEKYFTYFTRTGYIPEPQRLRKPVNYLKRQELTRERFTSMMQEMSGDDTLTVADAAPIDSTIGSTIIMKKTAAFKNKLLGFLPFRLQGCGCEGPFETDVMLKIKPTDQDVINAMRTATILLPDSRLAEEFKHAGGVANFEKCHIRELAISCQQDPRFTRNVPKIYGTWRDDDREIFLVMMEFLKDMVLMDTADDVSVWSSEHIRCALEGAAEFHSIWYGREEELKKQEWIGCYPTRERMEQFKSLWTVAARHAHQEFSMWFRKGDLELFMARIDSLSDWWKAMEALPKTLVHNDFNPRNIAFRQTDDGLRLCAFDWELATIHLPQRDVVELLAFVLNDDVTRDQIVSFVKYHRQALERYTGIDIDPQMYWQGFRCAAWDFLLNRGSFLILANTVNRYRWMNRVPFTLRKILDLVREG